MFCKCPGCYVKDSVQNSYNAEESKEASKFPEFKYIEFGDQSQGAQKGILVNHKMNGGMDTDRINAVEEFEMNMEGQKLSNEAC